MDWNKRREEIKQQDFEYYFDNVSEDEYYDRLISQEKQMIREFAKEFLKFNPYNKDRINKLLKENKIEEINGHNSNNRANKKKDKRN